jgi:hypothetical protein
MQESKMLSQPAFPNKKPKPKPFSARANQHNAIAYGPATGHPCKHRRIAMAVLRPSGTGAPVAVLPLAAGALSGIAAVTLSGFSPAQQGLHRCDG